MSFALTPAPGISDSYGTAAAQYLPTGTMVRTYAHHLVDESSSGPSGAATKLSYRKIDIKASKKESAPSHSDLQASTLKPTAQAAIHQRQTGIRTWRQPPPHSKHVLNDGHPLFQSKLSIT